jgi:hypothetical protein
MEYIFDINFSGQYHKLRAVIEYHSAQVMRIRVYGKQSTILLENNYPTLITGRSKKAIAWKIKEGGFVTDGPYNSRLLTDILDQLERIIKKEYPASNVTMPGSI